MTQSYRGKGEGLLQAICKLSLRNLAGAPEPLLVGNGFKPFPTDPCRNKPAPWGKGPPITDRKQTIETMPAQRPVLWTNFVQALRF